MVKKFTATCDFGGQKSPVTLYIGTPAVGSHPLGFQNKWLSSTKGGNVPADIMDSFAKLSEISNTNRVPFEELCSYVIDELKSNSSLASDAQQGKALSASTEATQSPPAAVAESVPVQVTESAPVENVEPSSTATDEKK